MHFMGVSLNVFICDSMALVNPQKMDGGSGFVVALPKSAINIVEKSIGSSRY